MADTNVRKFIVRSGLGATVVPPSNVIWVSSGGLDVTGTRGNAALPFLTFQAALSAAQSGDQIRVGPGVQTLAAPLVWPAGLTALSIVGSGLEATGIFIAAGNAFVVPSTLNSSLSFEDVTILAPGGTAVVADGTGLAGQFLSNGLIFSNTRLAGGTAGLAASYVGLVSMQNLRSDTDLTFYTCNFGPMDNVRVGTSSPAAINLTWDDDDADQPIAGRIPVIFRETLAGDLRLQGQPAFDFFPGCSLSTVGGFGFGIPAAITGTVIRIGLHCTVDSVDFSAAAGSALPDSVNSCFFSCEGANFGQVTVEVAGQATNPQTISATNCGIRSSLTVNKNAHWVDHELNATGGSFTSTTGGTITPGTYSATAAFPATPSTFTFPFLAGAVPDSVTVTGDVVAPGVLAVTAKSAADITVSSAGAASGNVAYAAHWG